MDTKPNPVARLLPSLTDVAFLMPLVFLFVRMNGAKALLGDGDTGWHIRTGQWILENGRVPDHDIFSFTKPGEPWYAWEWLWDVTFGWLHQHAGMAAVVVASMLVIAVTFVLVFRLAQRMCPNRFIAIGVTLAATAGSAMHWLARPHLFTLLFAAIYCHVLERARDGKTRLLILLPFLMVLWTNLHGGFFVGIILVGCYGAGELTSWLLEPQAQERRAALVRAKPYLLAAAACAAASLINPYTYHLHVHMYRFLSGSVHLQYIDEYQSTSFQNILAFWYEPMILAGIVAAAWNLYRRRFVYTYLLAGWAHLALFSVRNVPIYLIVAAPVIGQMLHEMILILAHAPVADWLRRGARNFEEFAAEFGEIDRIGRVHVVSLLPVLVLSVALYSPASPTSKFGAEYDPTKYPEKALQALRGPQFAKSIFTHDEWGDYLIYRLYPATKVFVDGRVDFYGAKFVKKYIDIVNVKYGWDETLKEYGVDTILLPVDGSLTGALKESRRWRAVYDDGKAIVFRSADAIAKTQPPGSQQSSAVNRDGRNPGDRKITKSMNRDPRITKSNTRSESL